jgi:hypothetical protein
MGFEEMKASPWEKDDAMHEDIPILNMLVPKEFTHKDGKLTGVMFEKVKAEQRGRRRLVPTGEPDQHFECDDVLRPWPENAFPWIERHRIEFDQWDMPVVDELTMGPPIRVFPVATRRSDRRTSFGRWRTGTGRRSPSINFATARACVIGRRHWST